MMLTHDFAAAAADVVVIVTIDCLLIPDEYCTYDASDDSFRIILVVDPTVHTVLLYSSLVPLLVLLIIRSDYCLLWRRTVPYRTVPFIPYRSRSDDDGGGLGSHIIPFHSIPLYCCVAAVVSYFRPRVDDGKKSGNTIFIFAAATGTLYCSAATNWTTWLMLSLLLLLLLLLLLRWWLWAHSIIPSLWNWRTRRRRCDNRLTLLPPLPGGRRCCAKGESIGSTRPGHTAR